jgi:hypothetical protein
MKRCSVRRARQALNNEKYGSGKLEKELNEKATKE